MPDQPEHRKFPHLPSEVWSLIAEQCVDSFQLRIRIPDPRDQGESLEVTGLPAVAELTTVNSSFAVGIRSGLRKKINPVLELDIEDCPGNSSQQPLLLYYDHARLRPVRRFADRITNIKLLNWSSSFDGVFYENKHSMLHSWLKLFSNVTTVSGESIAGAFGADGRESCKHMVVESTYAYAAWLASQIEGTGKEHIKIMYTWYTSHVPFERRLPNLTRTFEIYDEDGEKGLMLLSDECSLLPERRLGSNADLKARELHWE